MELHARCEISGSNIKEPALEDRPVSQQVQLKCTTLLHRIGGLSKQVVSRQRLLCTKFSRLAM